MLERGDQVVVLGHQRRMLDRPTDLFEGERGVVGQRSELRRPSNEPRKVLVWFHGRQGNWYDESQLRKLSLLELVAESAAGGKPVELMEVIGQDYR